MTALAAMTTTMTLAASLFGQASQPSAPAAQPAATGAAGAAGVGPQVHDYTGSLGPGVWFPESASTVAPGIDLVFDVITWISVFFFVAIVIIMVYFVVRYNRTRSPRSTSDVTHNTPLELTWTIIPLILVIAIFYVGLQGYLNLRVAPAGSYDVRVTAAKWSWAFAHPDGTIDTELLVPVNRPVRLIMESKDVLHACFIPAFRVKQDIIPGRYSTLWFEATKEGIFDLYCAEYCGKDHSQMRTKVMVLNEGAFVAELKRRGDIHKNLPDSKLAEYALEKLYPRCASCHSLDGKTGTGPSWRETNSLWGKERVFTDGTKQLVDENYIRDSILNPAAHVTANYTNAMPTFKGQLDDRQIAALVLAIKNLQDFDTTGKLLPGKVPDSQLPGGFPGLNADGAGSSTAPATSPATTPATVPPAATPAAGH